MGYTHSWYRDKEIQRAIMKSIAIDFAKLRISLHDKSEIIDAPDFWGEPGDIAFGGKAITCEPMIFCHISAARCITIERATEEWKVGKYFEYCKTERLPYDLAVKSLLIIMKFYLSDEIRIFTDGDDNDWAESNSLCNKVLGYGDLFFIKNHELLKH